MADIRILTGWTKEEREELEAAEGNGYYQTSIDVINAMTDHDDSFKSIYKKYQPGFTKENNQLAKDIADYFTSDAEFSEKEYYVKIPLVNKCLFLYKTNGEYFLTRFCDQADNYQIKFTEQEIIAIDPIYMMFAIEVGD